MIGRISRKTDPLTQNSSMQDVPVVKTFQKFILFGLFCPIAAFACNYIKAESFADTKLMHFLSKHFSGGNTLEDALRLGKRLRGLGLEPAFLNCTEDVGFSDVLESFRNHRKMLENKMICLKLSAFLNHDAEFLDFHKSLKNFLNFANEMKSGMTRLVVDAEESLYQTLINEYVFAIMKIMNSNDAYVVNTYQAYRKDTEELLVRHVEESEKEGFVLGVKLVRGAYLGYENLCRTDRVLPSKSIVDEAFDNLLKFLLKKIEERNNIFLLVATHNVKSVKKIIPEVLMMKNRSMVQFAQLYGMGESVKELLFMNGLRSCVYLPYGSPSQIVHYLARRAQENTSRTNLGLNELSYHWKHLIGLIKNSFRKKEYRF